MEKLRRKALIGGFMLLILAMSMAWFFSQEITATTDFHTEPESGAKLNLYRTCRVNGMAGVAWFLMSMPDTLGYDTCWHRTLDWLWGMRRIFTVPGAGNYYKWPDFQGDTAYAVNIRQQAGVGAAFIDGFAEASDSTKFQERAKEVAKFLRLIDDDYVVMKSKYDATFDTLNWWRYKDSLPGDTSTPMRIRYSYDGGNSAIGLYFLNMYKHVGDSDTSTYFKIARNIAQFIKSVAVTVIISDTLCSKWAIGDSAGQSGCKWNDFYSTTHCEGAAGIVTFLDSMYVYAAAKSEDSAVSDSSWVVTGLNWLRARAHREEDTLQEEPLEIDSLYWWYQYPNRASDPVKNEDSTYSPTWGRGAAGIGETFLMAIHDLAGTSSDSTTYYHYARGAAKWVQSKAEITSGGYRWPYLYGYHDPDDDTTWYYTYFCKGQGPIIKFFSEMNEYARNTDNSDSTDYYNCADSGWKYLEGTKIQGYEGGFVWDGKQSDPERTDSNYTTISVSVEGGPPGLGLAMIGASNFIDTSQGLDDSLMSLAHNCADWLKAEIHIDSVFPKNVDPVGGYKWSWRVAEDSITVEIKNVGKYILDHSDGDTLRCSLFVYNWDNDDSKEVFWWIDFLKPGGKFTWNPPHKGDSGTTTISAGGTFKTYHECLTIDVGTPQASLDIAVNGVAAFWLDRDDRLTRYALDQDCFQVTVVP